VVGFASSCASLSSHLRRLAPLAMRTVPTTPKDISFVKGYAEGCLPVLVKPYPAGSVV
jgi:hypothetical protein